MSSSPIRDYWDTQDARLRALGITPAPEALPAYREQRLRELGLENMPSVDLDAEWVPVTSSLKGPNTPSSNVEAIRWVGGEYGLQVRFLAKGKRPSSTYEYAAPKSVFDDMLAVMSKGQFVWHILRADRVPYRRIS